jgi:hypothetical protein
MKQGVPSDICLDIAVFDSMSLQYSETRNQAVSERASERATDIERVGALKSGGRGGGGTERKDKEMDSTRVESQSTSQ